MPDPVMEHHDRVRLPDSAQRIQRLECIRIADTDTETHLWTTVPGATIGAWEGADVGSIVELVSGLPDGEPMRCFIPRYGVRAHGADEVLFEIAFCFRCNWAMTIRPGQQERGRLTAFDAGSPAARHLLERIKALDPQAPADGA